MKGNLSFASEDIRRMIESRFDKVSLADAGQLTDSAALRAAVDEAVHELWVARTELVDSALAVAREVGETGEARDGLADVSSTSTAEWQYVRFEVERGLLNPLPEARPDAATMARRRKLFGELFALTDGDFSRLTSARKVEVLQGPRRSSPSPQGAGGSPGRTHHSAPGASRRRDRGMAGELAARDARRPRGLPATLCSSYCI